MSLCLCGWLAAARAGEAPEKPARFAVHEWGVQVRTVGRLAYEQPLACKPDGHVEMRPVQEPGGKTGSLFSAPDELVAGLPGFVLRHAAAYRPKYRNVGGWDKPVLHFYGAEGLEVSVQVLTPRGRPLAYWPKPAMVEKERKGNWIAGTDLLGLAWKGRLSAKPAGKVAEVPAGHWWGTVREVPGLWLNAGADSERFVFYEASALGDPTLVGRVGADELTIENTHTAGTGQVVVIVNDGAERRFAGMGDLAKGFLEKLTGSTDPEVRSSAERLLEELAAATVVVPDTARAAPAGGAKR
jgi:hypothetical protein